MQSEATERRVDGSPWQARIAVLWRDEQLPVPIGEASRSIAVAAGVRLSTRPGSCVAYFDIAAETLGEAIPRALGKWASVVDEASLPNWEIVSFSLDQVDEDDRP